MRIASLSRNHLTKRQRSNKSEQELAKQYGGRQQPASGAIPVAGLKGDVITGQFLFDDKTTVRKSFTVSHDVLAKLSKDAFRTRRIPVLRVHFEQTRRAYFVIDETTFRRLSELLKDEDGE